MDCPKLEKMTLNDIGVMQGPDLRKCPEITSFSITNCYGLQTPPDISACMSLKSGSFNGCSVLMSLPVIPAGLLHFTKFDAYDCAMLERIET